MLTSALTFNADEDYVGRHVALRYALPGSKVNDPHLELRRLVEDVFFPLLKAWSVSAPWHILLCSGEHSWGLSFNCSSFSQRSPFPHMVNLLLFSLSVGGLLRRTRESSFLVWLQQTLGHRVPFSQRRLVDPMVDKVALLTSDHNVRVPENSEMLGDRGGCDVERACQRVYAQGASLSNSSMRIRVGTERTLKMRASFSGSITICGRSD